MIITDKTFDDKIVRHCRRTAILWMQSYCVRVQICEFHGFCVTIEMFFAPNIRSMKFPFQFGVKIAKFNSFYYYGLIPEITNKKRYALQSHQTNDNEYRKKRMRKREHAISTFFSFIASMQKKI